MSTFACSTVILSCFNSTTFYRLYVIAIFSRCCKLIVIYYFVAMLLLKLHPYSDVIITDAGCFFGTWGSWQASTPRFNHSLLKGGTTIIYYSLCIFFFNGCSSLCFLYSIWTWGTWRSLFLIALYLFICTLSFLVIALFYYALERFKILICFSDSNVFSNSNFQAVREIVRASRHEACAIPNEAESFSLHVKSEVVGMKKGTRKNVSKNVIPHDSTNEMSSLASGSCFNVMELMNIFFFFFGYIVFQFSYFLPRGKNCYQIPCQIFFVWCSLHKWLPFNTHWRRLGPIKSSPSSKPWPNYSAVSYMKFCFAIPVYARLNPYIGCTSLNLSVLLPSMSLSA